MISMVNELCIVNTRGVKARVGDKIKLDLLVQGWMNKIVFYTITEIRTDGSVILDGSINQHISGIRNFTKSN